MTNEELEFKIEELKQTIAEKDSEIDTLKETMKEMKEAVEDSIYYLNKAL